MNPPTKYELIEDNDDLDACCVVKHFLGKTADEAYEMFRSAGCMYSEDLMWMSPPGLEYYLPPAVKYLESEDSRGNFDFALFTLGALMFQVTTNQLPPSLVTSIHDLAAYLKSNSTKFDVDASHPGEDLFFEYIEKIENAIG